MKWNMITRYLKAYETGLFAAVFVCCAVAGFSEEEPKYGDWGPWDTFDSEQNMWTKTCVSVDQPEDCCKVDSTTSAGGSEDNPPTTDCAWITTGLGAKRPGVSLGPGRLQISGEKPTPSMSTPQGARFILGYGIHSISGQKTSTGLPRDITIIDPKGITIGLRFLDGESIASPFLGPQQDIQCRMIMVDAAGWATTTNPAYSDLYPGNGELYRFMASTNSDQYLEMVLYRGIGWFLVCL